MLDFTYTDFINEEMSVISRKKLRDAMHDILVELGPKETLDVEQMSNILMTDYKVDISPFFLDKFLDDFLRAKAGDKKARTFFTKADTRWLGVRDINGTKEIRNNLLHLKPALTKHKRRLFADDERKKLDDIYKSGMKDLSFSEDVIKKSLVLQKPEDSIDIMKLIYTDVISNKRYDNTYDNCWKLMMIIGRRYNLDRVRGWFKLAPQSVKDDYFKSPEGQRKINYELTKPKPTTKNVEQKKDINLPETQRNLAVVDRYLNKYKNWEDFIRQTDLRTLIEIIDSLNTRTSPGFGLEIFVQKIDQFNLILQRFYHVDRKDIISYYKNVGLAKYLRQWQMGGKPKINDF